MPARTVADVARTAGVYFLKLINGQVAAGWLFRHHVPVLRRDVATGRLTVKQFVIRGNGFLGVPGGGKQASLLEGLATIRRGEQHGSTGGLIGTGIGRHSFQAIQLFCAPAVSPCRNR